uniref:Uncharacterized protein n=1 Tax=Solanum tuberosum TaxID=4113 RepID=M1CB25_SOLTU
MVLRLNIDRIELAPRDWICKVQIVEMGRPRESPDKKCRFQNLILEDKERQSLSLDNVHQMLSNKVFQIELRKSSWGNSNSTHATLSILSYMEKEHTPQSTTDRNSKKIRPLEISEVDVTATTTAAGSSNAAPKFEPPTPTKKV